MDAQMNANTATQELDEINTEIQQRTEFLLQGLKAALGNVGLSDADVASRTGLNRITVQRAKKDGADPKLSSFVAMASAAGVIPTLQKQEIVDGYTDEKKVVHRGYSYVRINRDKSEKAFAKTWEAINQTGVGVQPIMRYLVPNYTQDQASAVATVVQWLGTTVGFEFLTDALKNAGYSVTALTEAE